MEQRTEEWFAARCGKVTASRVADATARTKTGWGATRANYMAELICERLTGKPTQGFTNAAMQWGTDTEPRAIETYAFERALTIEPVGFVPHPEIADSGASPDGLVGEDGLVEVKCPNTATHLDYLLTQTVPAKYLTQMQWQMACTGRRWCDFVSYDPRLPDHLATFVKRVARDDDRIAELETGVREFLAELGEKVARLEAMSEAA